MKKVLLIFIFTVISYTYSQSQSTYYQKDILRKDLSFFKEKLTNIHPIFCNQDFYSIWQKEFVKTELLLKDSMTQNEFYLIVAPLEALLNDAHSNVLCPMEQRRIFMLEKGGLAFPILVKIQNESVFVSEYHGDDSTLFAGGEEIIEINSLPVPKILSEMSQLVGSEVSSMRNKTIEMNFRMFLWMKFGFEKDYELLLKNAIGKTKKIFVKGITNDQFLKNRKRYKSLNQKLYSLNIEKETAFLTIKSVADLVGFCSFADSAFNEISKSKCKNLIIDIRGNTGGRSIVVDSLMNYLTDKSYSQYKKIEARISQELKDYYKTKYPDVYKEIKEIPVGNLFDFPCELTIPLYQKNRFEGNIFLLTDSYTYSGAATFAGLFKELKLGTIIGEETGGTIEYFGDFWFHELPSTKLQFHISPKRFVQYGGDDLKRGVLPDYTVPNIKNSILEFTYGMISE
ncbi:MAG: S41 family peptidase [Tenuifilaceae bacterium]